MEVHVPHDVIFNHILPRVPTKSIGRFMRVSKEWHSVIRSDMFKNKHNRHVDDHENNLKFMILSKTKKSFEFAIIDCEAPQRRKGLTPIHRPLPQSGDTTPDYIHILTSFHGLVCLGILKDTYDEYCDLILWNPLTSQSKRLSKSDSHKVCNNFLSGSSSALYYSCCEDDYKLLFVNFTDGNVYIYSSRSDSWRKVDGFQHTSKLYPGSRSGGTYLNENIYFPQHQSNGKLSSIIRFDTKSERFSEIDTHCVDYNEDADDYFATIVVISNCIHVCVKYDAKISGSLFGRTSCIKLWKLDEYGNMKEVLTYQLRPHYVADNIKDLIPYHLMKNGKWLMLRKSCSYTHRFYKVDLKKNRHITNKGKEKEKGNIYDDFEYAIVRINEDPNIKNMIHIKGGYIETFVSPNRI